MKNVMIDGATCPLGMRLADALSKRDDVERLVGLEATITSQWASNIELLASEPDHRLQLEFIRDYEIDTVIQCSLARNRSGEIAGDRSADVIRTMRLGATIGSASCPVRSWVVLSSSAVYPHSSAGPLLKRETDPIATADTDRGSALVEAEQYALDIARRSPHLNVAILRLQELVGPDFRGPLSTHFNQAVVPTVLGYDPAIQFLHVEDAISAIAFAAELELAGIYNVASRDIVRLSEFMLSLGRPNVLHPPFRFGALSTLAALARLPHITEEVFDLLRFGHAVDTAKIETAGFKPMADQLDCAAVLNHQSSTRNS
jgi:UDP-glucose 4-epimerase